MTSIAKFEGRFDKHDFILIAKDDEYQCPAGQRAISRFAPEEDGLEIRLSTINDSVLNSTEIRR